MHPSSVLIIALLVALNNIMGVFGCKADEPGKIRKHETMKAKKHHSRIKSIELESNGHDLFGSEEFSSKTVQAQRLDQYQVIHVNGKLLNSSSAVIETKSRAKTSKEEKKGKHSGKGNSKSSKNAYFHVGIDDRAEISDVGDECPKMRSTVTEKNAQFKDSMSSGNYRVLPELSYGAGERVIESYEDNSDILCYQVKACNLYTCHSPEFDGRSSISKKEEQIHLRRCPHIHPNVGYNRNNEIDPTVPFYADDRDIGTSQREMDSNIGRQIGRDKKPKTFQNSNSFESKNDNCVIC